MRSSSPASLVLALGLAGRALADPTWPSPIDELEEIMFQLTSFRARKFADTVSPCTNEASGPGRQNAAEWLRTAFHDMSTANTFFKTGGLDGSLQYELDNGENTGPGHKTTLQFMAPFVSPRSSLSDLIALGVYTSVRSCGGPAVPFRAGRKDATEKGATGVPQPQNSVVTFQQQFERMGFTTEEMIQVTACGHTIGGVHKDEFPDLMPPNAPANGEVPLDSTVAVFDNKVVTEYLSGNTTNPLVVGPSVAINKNSDFKVFNADSNKTMTTMTDNDKFKDICKVVLQKMIDVVPPGVTLTDPIVPYTVKPVNLQLTLAQGGTMLSLTGYIRVKTTGLPDGSVKSITITYKDRKGSADCGSSSCAITSSLQGVGQGFDDTFAFFPISATIPAASGISSFTVTVNDKTYDNNGKGYPLQDDIIFQAPQSCVTGNAGAVTLVAAVRNDVAASNGAQATVYYKEPQTGSPVPLQKSAAVQLKKGNCVGKYTLFTSDYTIQGGLPYQSHVDVTAGTQTDGFKSLTDIGGTCRPFDNPAPCDGGEPPVSSTTTTTTTDTTTTTTTTSDGGSTTTTSTTAAPTETLHHRDAVGGYKMVSCWTEGTGARALTGNSFANDSMTLEKCMNYCSAYVYWGTEYGRECEYTEDMAPLTLTDRSRHRLLRQLSRRFQQGGPSGRLQHAMRRRRQPVLRRGQPSGALLNDERARNAHPHGDAHPQAHRLALHARRLLDRRQWQAGARAKGHGRQRHDQRRMRHLLQGLQVLRHRVRQRVLLRQLPRRDEPDGTPRRLRHALRRRQVPVLRRQQPPRAVHEPQRDGRGSPRAARRGGRLRARRVPDRGQRHARAGRRRDGRRRHDQRQVRRLLQGVQVLRDRVRARVLLREQARRVEQGGAAEGVRDAVRRERAAVLRRGEPPERVYQEGGAAAACVAVTNAFAAGRATEA